MTATATTAATRQLVAVWCTENHAFILGERFNDVTPLDVFEFVSNVYGGRVVESVCTLGAILFTAREPEPEPIAVLVTEYLEADEPQPAIANAEPEPVPVTVDIRKGDKPWKMDAAALASTYGMRKTSQKCMFSIGNDKDAERILYRQIATGAAFAQYHGQFWAIPESSVMPEVAPVTVKHTAPAAAEPEPERKQASGKREKWACFHVDGKPTVRKVHYNDCGERYVSVGGEQVLLVNVAPASTHNSKEKALKMAEQHRKQAKRAEKLQDERKQAKQAKQDAAAKFEMPTTYNGAPVRIVGKLSGAMATPESWAKVASLCDDITAAGFVVGRIDIDREIAWAYPLAPVGFTDAFKHAIEAKGNRWYSEKPNRGAWFVKPLAA